MMVDEMELFIGKTVKVSLDNGFMYSGKVKNVSPNGMIVLDFKTNHEIFVNLTSIKTIEVLR